MSINNKTHKKMIKKELQNYCDYKKYKYTDKTKYNSEIYNRQIPKKSIIKTYLNKK